MSSAVFCYWLSGNINNTWSCHIRVYFWFETFILSSFSFRSLNLGLIDRVLFSHLCTSISKEEYFSVLLMVLNFIFIDNFHFFVSCCISISRNFNISTITATCAFPAFLTMFCGSIFFYSSPFDCVFQRLIYLPMIMYKVNEWIQSRIEECKCE